MKRVMGVASLLIALCAFALSARAYEKINWNHKALTAGKASLTSKSYLIQKTLGVPNFSPEFSLSLQLIYNSQNEKYGIFGYGWNCPQLESRVFPRRDGAEWVSPWGEKIRFYNKDAITKDSLKIYQDAAKGGRGCFSPYSDWEANGDKGDWRITGKKSHKGWKFEYSESLLKKITAPSGRVLAFNYNKGKIAAVSENGLELVKLDYNKAGRIESFVINGISYKAGYSEVSAEVLSNKVVSSPSYAKRQMLSSIQMGTLATENYTYDAYGYLNSTKRGDYTDNITVEHETWKERNAYLNAVAEARKNKKSVSRVTRDKFAGRILEDHNLKYSYDKKQVTVRNDAGQNAVYKYDQQSGILDITDFAGLNTKIYYFRRYDVAYNGKVRQITDAQGRIAVSYKYDKATGKLLRTRDMADNETYYSYDNEGNLIKISRSEDGVSGKRPLVGLKYDRKGNPTSILKLDSKGKDVWDTKLVYNNLDEVTSVATAESRTAIKYNRYGKITQVTDTFGRTTTRRYDKLNRVTDVIAANGSCVNYQYDANGQITGIKRYSTMNKQQLLSSVTFNYDSMGQVASVTDNQGRTRKFDRDTEGRVIKEYFPDNTVVGYKYTKLGQLNRTIDPNGHKIAFKWNKFGKLDILKTAVGQQAEYEYNQYGLLVGLKNTWKKQTDRDIKYTYNKLDRLVKIDYGKDKTKTFEYDRLGKVTKVTATDGDTIKTEELKYTEFDQLYQKIATETTNGKETSKLIYQYSYLPNGKRHQRLILYPNGSKSKTVWNYDLYGRLAEINDNAKTVTYKYNSKNQLVEQVINGVPAYYTYTKLGQLEGKYLGSKTNAIAYLKYTYDNDGMITARNVSGANQLYSYDLKGQLTKVTQNGNAVEEYSYDAAGNILKKTVQGKTTEFSYDASNQLVSAKLPDGTIKDFSYDAAGRMTKQGTKSYSYGWMNKVMSISENGKVSATYDYHVDGQVASMTKVGAAVPADSKGALATAQITNFYWDGLALIKRGDMSLTNEPYVTGGNPVIAGDKTLFNDMLGTTQGSTDGDRFAAINRDAFGQTLDNSTDSDYDYFTGKPKVEGLGYAFLFRNYNAGLGKWTTSDPLGYLDGWNNFAYCRNHVTISIDWQGSVHINLFPTDEDIYDYANKTNDSGGNFRVGGHGNENGVYDAQGNLMTPQQLADLIQNHSDYTAGQDIDLLSCNVGNGTFAQELANILNANVRAANDYVYFDEDGHVWVAGESWDDYGSMITFKPE